MKARKPLMKWVAVALTALILAAIYMSVDSRMLLRRLADMDLWYFCLAVAVFIPQILVTSVRWRLMVERIRPMSLWESIRLVMAGKAMNALVPSKLGEMSKAYFLKREGDVDTGPAVSAVVLEKVFDLAGLCAVLLAGVIFVPEASPAVWAGALISVGTLTAFACVLALPLAKFGGRFKGKNAFVDKVVVLMEGWDLVLALWKEKKGVIPAIFLLSVLLWACHLLQIYLFFPSLRHWIPVAPALAYVPLELLIGLLPVTIAGMGTRDTALIFLFRSYADPSVMAGIGLLCSARYWVDTLLGVPFFHYYMNRLSALDKLSSEPARKGRFGPLIRRNGRCSEENRPR